MSGRGRFALLALLLAGAVGCPDPTVEADDDSTEGDDDTAGDDDATGDDDSAGDDDATGDDDTTEECPEFVTWYEDADEDGYGNPDAAQEFCGDEEPTGYVLDDSDCADDDPTAYPGSHATEVPFDGVDQDCDGLDACRDLNCDGWPDLVFAQTDEDEDYHIDSWIYFGSATGYSDQDRAGVPTIGGMGVDSGDFDGDGYVDLAFASVQDGENREIDSLVYYNSATGFDEANRTELPTIGCADPTVADVDQDGWLDIVFSNRYRGGFPSPDTYSNDSAIYWGGPNGFSENDVHGLPTVGAARSRVADLDGDGHMDLVFANGVTELFFMNESFVYWGSNGGWSEGDRTELVSIFPEGLAVEDLDGDGDLDVFLTSWMCLLYCDDASRIYWNDGTGNFPDSTHLLESTGGVDVQVGDLDQDGHVDMVIANGGVDVLGGFADVSWIYWGSATGFSDDERQEIPTTAASECGIEDLDGDGWDDIVCASHYEPDDGGPEVSQIYWSDAGTFDEINLTELPTQHAAGMTIVGSVFLP